METPLASGEHVQVFAEQLLNTGDTLINLVENLVEALVENGSDRDEATTDILAMLTETVTLRFSSIPVADVVRATELIALAMQSVLDDLLRALALMRQRN